MLIATLAFLTYGLIYATVAAPLLPQKFRSAQIDARKLRMLSGPRLARSIARDPRD